MRRGRDIYRDLERAEADLRVEESRTAQRIAELAEEAAEIRRAEASAYRALAQARLDALAQSEVTGRLEAAERAALDALEDRKRRLAEAEAEATRLEGVLASAIEEREGAEDRLEAATDALEALADQTQDRLSEDPDWTAAHLAWETAQSHADAAEEKADRAETDRAEKSQAYDADPLFSYLWARSYDTPDYKASGIVKHFDAKVAKLVGYAGARPDYFRLHEIPRRLRAHADGLATEAADALAALEALERQGLEADGSGPLETDLTDAETALAAIEGRIEETEAALDAQRAAADALTDPDADQGLRRAFDGLVAAFETTDLHKLARDARATPRAEDDQAVARLADLERDVERVDADLAAARRSERDIARRRADLAEERRRFRQQGFGAPGGGFDNSEVLGELIGGLVKGAAAGALADALGKGYHRRKRSARPGFGGIRTGRQSARPARPASSGGFRTGSTF